MIYRFSLDDQIDADLIALIKQKANGGSVNKSMKLFVQISFAIQSDGKVTAEYQKSDSFTSNQEKPAIDDEINLSSLDDAFS